MPITARQAVNAAGVDEVAASADDAIRDDHEAYWSGYLDDLRDLLEEADEAAPG